MNIRDINRESLMELIKRTGLPFLSTDAHVADRVCRQALAESEGDIEEAMRKLRRRFRPTFGVMDGDRQQPEEDEEQP